MSLSVGRCRRASKRSWGRPGSEPAPKNPANSPDLEDAPRLPGDAGAEDVDVRVVTTRERLGARRGDGVEQGVLVADVGAELLGDVVADAGGDHPAVPVRQ